LHSPQYFQCARVLQFPKHLHLLCGEIARHFEYNEVEVVLSPAIGGIVVGTEVGRMLGARTIFAERKDGKMELRRGFEIIPGERVLVVEDVVTTGGSTKEVIDLVTNAKGSVVGTGCIVDRSNGKVQFNTKTVRCFVIGSSDSPAAGMPYVQIRKHGSETGKQRELLK